MNFLFAKNEMFPYLLIIPIIALIFVFISKKTISLIKNIQKPKIIGVISDYSLNQNNQHNYSSYPIHIIREQYINNLSKTCSEFNVVFIILSTYIIIT